jgi:hypothetical protein
VRYLDSRSRDPGDTLHAWLANLLPGARHFAAQTGYFRFDALEPYLEDLLQMLEEGGRFDLVVGANEDRLSAADLEAALELIDSFVPLRASLTLVGSRDGLFHPKAYFVDTGTGRHALIGSGNLTRPGSTHNVEAFVAVDDGDDPSIPDGVRDAILSWRDSAENGGLAQLVTDRLVQKLLAKRAIDPVPLADIGGRERRPSDRDEFPRLSRIRGMPARRRLPSQDGSRRRLRGARQSFPSGTIGVVKRLSATDLKGFAGGSGTLHLSLGARNSELAPCLPMRPFGKNAEPRLDVAVVARFDLALDEVVTSGADPTNITHVGMGHSGPSNPDLRFNLLRGIVSGLADVATRRGIDIPTPGDVAAVELLESGRLARVTFVTTDPLRSELLDRIPAGRASGWLDSGRLPPW